MRVGSQSLLLCIKPFNPAGKIMKKPILIALAILIVVIFGINFFFSGDQMEQPIGTTFSSTSKGGFRQAITVNLQEKTDRYIVTVNAPGVDESSMDVKLDDRQLQIDIKTRHAEERTDDNNNGQYSYKERYMGEFQKVLTLPGPVKEDKMKTDYDDGVLTITIPKEY